MTDRATTLEAIATNRVEFPLAWMEPTPDGRWNLYDAGEAEHIDWLRAHVGSELGRRVSDDEAWRWAADRGWVRVTWDGFEVLNPEAVSPAFVYDKLSRIARGTGGRRARPTDTVFVDLQDGRGNVATSGVITMGDLRDASSGGWDVVVDRARSPATEGVSPRVVYHAGGLSDDAEPGVPLTVVPAAETPAWLYVTDEDLADYAKGAANGERVRSWRDAIDIGSSGGGQVYPFGNYVEEELAKLGMTFGSPEEMARSLSVLWVDPDEGEMVRWAYRGGVIEIDLSRVPDVIAVLDDPGWSSAYIVVLPYKEGNIPADAWSFVGRGVGESTWEASVEASMYLLEAIDWEDEFRDFYASDDLQAWWRKNQKKYKPKPRPPFDPRWEIPRKLARSSRPGYPTRREPIPVEKVDEWIAGAKEEGIRSIIVLLDDEQLALYPDVPGGLVDYYRANGFDVAHVPTKDLRMTFPVKWDPKKKQKHRPAPKDTQWVGSEDLERAYAAYRSMPKPVLVHCSAGLDRSGQVVRYIKEREAGGGVKESCERVRADADLTMSSAEASVYLMEARFSRYDYKVPKDKEQQLYDFYIMGLLPDPGTLEAGGSVGQAAPGKSRWKQPRPDMADAVRDVRDKLIPRLKTNLLNATYYAMAAETRHILDHVHGTSPEEIVKRVRADLGEEDARRLAKYLREYHAYQKYSVSSGISREPTGRVKRVMGQAAGYDNSYRAAIKAFRNDPVAFARVSEWLFRNLSWSGGYGGKKWGDISRGWRWLNDAKTYGDNLKYIDHVYDLQHNTDVMLNKVKSYAKGGGYKWLKTALDKKKYAQSPFHMYNDMSPGLRSLAAAAIKWYLDMTLEDYLKSPESGKASTTKGGYKAPVPSAPTPGGKKDYVPVFSTNNKDQMAKSLYKWYGVGEEQAKALVSSAIAKHGVDVVSKWQWPSTVLGKFKSTEMWAPAELNQGDNANLVMVNPSKTEVSTTEKHKYFKPGAMDPAQAWMSAKGIGLQPSMLASAGQQPAPAAKPEAPKPAAPKPKLKKKVLVPEPTADQASGALTSTYIELFQPPSKIPAIKGIRMTYGIGLKDAKKVVDDAEGQTFPTSKTTGQTVGYLQLWWPSGKYVTLGPDATAAKGDNWGTAQVAFATDELLGSQGQWKFLSKEFPMVQHEGVWYIKASDIVNASMVQDKAVEAPMMGETMVQVMTDIAAAGKAQSLVDNFGVPPQVAENAVAKLPKSLDSVYWITSGPVTGKFATDYKPGMVSRVALWSAKHNGIVQAKLQTWVRPKLSEQRAFVRQSSLDSVRIQASGPPVEAATEGQMQFVVKDVTNETDGAPTDQLSDAVKAAKFQLQANPGHNVVIAGNVFMDGSWWYLKMYDAQGNEKSTNATVMQKMQTKGLAPVGAEPEPDWKVAQAKLPLWFEVKIKHPQKGWTVAYDDKFAHWGQVQVALKDLKDSYGYTGDSVAVEKHATPAMWPEWHELDDAAKNNQFHQPSYHVETLEPGGIVKWVMDSWKTAADSTPSTDPPWLGEDPKTREAAAELVAYAKTGKAPEEAEPTIATPFMDWTVAQANTFWLSNEAEAELAKHSDQATLGSIWDELPGDVMVELSKEHKDWKIEQQKVKPAAEPKPSTIEPGTEMHYITLEQAIAELPLDETVKQKLETIMDSIHGQPGDTIGSVWGSLEPAERNGFQLAYDMFMGKNQYKPPGVPSKAIPLDHWTVAQAMYYLNAPGEAYYKLRELAQHGELGTSLSDVWGQFSESAQATLAEGFKNFTTLKPAAWTQPPDPSKHMGELHVWQVLKYLPVDESVREAIKVIVNANTDVQISSFLSDAGEKFGDDILDKISDAYDEYKKGKMPEPSTTQQIWAWATGQATKYLDLSDTTKKELVTFGVTVPMHQAWSGLSDEAKGEISDAHKSWHHAKAEAPKKAAEPEPEEPADEEPTVYKIHDPSKGRFDIRLYKGAYKDDPSEDNWFDGSMTYDNFDDAKAELTSWLEDYKNETGDTAAFGEVMQMATPETWDGPEEFVSWWDEDELEGDPTTQTDEWKASLKAYESGEAGEPKSQLQPTTLHDWTAGEVMKAIGKHPTAHVDAIAATALTNLPKDAPMSGAFPQFSSKTQANIKKAFRMMGLELQTEGEVAPPKKEPEAPKPDVEHMNKTVAQILSEFGDVLTDQSKMDLEDNHGFTLDAAWDSLSGETQADINDAVAAGEPSEGPALEDKPWNAWTVMQAVQLGLPSDTKSKLKTFGGNQVLGEVWGELTSEQQKQIMSTIGEWQQAYKATGPAPEDEPPEDEPPEDEPPEDEPPEDEPPDEPPPKPGTVPPGMSHKPKPTSSEPGYKFPHPMATTKKKPKAKKEPGEAQAMKALQSWKIADALKYLMITEFTIDQLKAAAVHSKKQTVMSVWSLLGDNAQQDIISAWIAHKGAKQAAPKKPKKGKKVPTWDQAEKAVQTWKIGDVLKFLKLDAYPRSVIADYMKPPDAWPASTKVGDKWAQLSGAVVNDITAKYIEFMKQKHGLEHAAARAAAYLAEGATFPRIVRRRDYGAVGGLDLYFVKWREDGREYCYALGRSLRSTIDNIESKSAAKAASIVKARSAGEYDCSTGEIKHREPKPKRARKKRKVRKSEPTEVQTTLFDESAEASAYLLEAGEDPLAWTRRHPMAWDNPEAPAYERPRARGAYVDRASGVLYGPDHQRVAFVGRGVPVDAGDADVFPVPADLEAGLQTGSPEELEDVVAAVRRAWRVWEDAEGYVDDVVEAVNRRELHAILEERVDGAGELALAYVDEPPPRRGLSAEDRKVRDRLKTDEFPATAEDGKAFVFHWADGRGACAFRRKKDAIAWIEDDVNHEGQGPDIVGFWYSEPYVGGRQRKGRKKKKKLRVANSYTKTKPKKGRKTEDVDRDAEATRMLARYVDEPTSIWLYTDMPVWDRVAWAYLAADRFKGVEGEDLVARFVETLKQVVDDPETFWQQIEEKDPTRANYLRGSDWDIETVKLEDVGVYPRFSGFSDEVCSGSVVDTANAIQLGEELPEKVAKLEEMAEVWTTVLKFLPPILVPGGTLRGRKEGYERTEWDVDDGNHRLVAAAMAGAKEAVCFVGRKR